MELSEATALSSHFITSLLFKIHSLPASARSASAVEWWRGEGSRIPLGPALKEARRHLGHFASRPRTKIGGRQIFVTLSAIVNDDGQGSCPALSGNLCSIYDARPLTCRTVPMHYSRAPSTLGRYIDSFTSTPGYRCDTTPSAPMVLNGNEVLDPLICEHRNQAIELAKIDRTWKKHMLQLMDDDKQAGAAQLPTFKAVIENANRGYFTQLPMIVAWRAAMRIGLLSSADFTDICRKQLALIKARLPVSGTAELSAELHDLMALYQFELAAAERREEETHSLMNRSRN